MVIQVIEIANRKANIADNEKVFLNRLQTYYSLTVILNTYFEFFQDFAKVWRRAD